MVYLVGNKIDLADKREIARAEAEQFAQKECLVYVETSAIQNTGVSEAFQSLLNDIYQIRKEDIQNEDNSLQLKPDEDDKKKSYCCLLSWIIIITTSSSAIKLQL